MIFDGIVLSLTSWKLWFRPGSTLRTILIRDGLIYFIVAFSANLIQSIFVLVNLNPVLSITNCMLAMTAGVICSCRAYLHLADFYGESWRGKSSSHTPPRGMFGLSPPATQPTADDGKEIQFAPGTPRMSSTTGTGVRVTTERSVLSSEGGQFSTLHFSSAFGDPIPEDPESPVSYEDQKPHDIEMGHIRSTLILEPEPRSRQHD